MSTEPRWQPVEGSPPEPQAFPWQAPGGDDGRPPRIEPARDRGGLQAVRARVHRLLLERLNLGSLESADRTEARKVIRSVVHELLLDESLPLNYEEREHLMDQVLDEIFGLGPLEPLMKDPDGHRHPGEHATTGSTCERRGTAGAHGRALPGQSPPACRSSTGSSRRSAAGSTSRRPMVDARLRTARA